MAVSSGQQLLCGCLNWPAAIVWLSKLASRVQLEQARAGAEERLMRLNDVEATVADFNIKVLCSSRAVHCIALHFTFQCISVYFSTVHCSAV